jgi:hypothetical protein
LKIHKKFPGKKGKSEEGQGAAPLGLPPPLGERGGHPHIFLSFRKMDLQRISPDPRNFSSSSVYSFLLMNLK